MNEVPKLATDEIPRAAPLPRPHYSGGQGIRPETSGRPLPPKIFPPTSSYPSHQPSSSMRDTQITGPSRLFTGQGSSEKDEYLLRLLNKGIKPPLAQLHHSSSLLGSSAGFRVPDPVFQRTRVSAPGHLLPPRHQPGTSAPSLQAGTGTGTGTGTATESGQPQPRPARQPRTATAWSFADTQRCMGQEAAMSLRSAVINHQVAFLDQLYDFHRALAVQVRIFIVSNSSSQSQ